MTNAAQVFPRTAMVPLEYECLLSALESHRDGIPLTDVQRATLGELSRFVYVHARLIVSEPSIAEDVMQSVLSNVVVHLLTHERPPHLERWLAGCAHNAGWDHLRRVRRETRKRDAFETLASCQGIGTTHPVAGTDDRLTLDKLLSVLSDNDRLIIAKYFFEDSSERELAGSLGIGLNTAKSRLRRAIDRLRAHAMDMQTAEGLRDE
jgi:RNA polymerase sigma-70 factor (ECF subfamily)